MAQHIIKRNPNLSGTKERSKKNTEMWFVQKRKNGSPAGIHSNVGDSIYLYEVGYAVWASGIITAIREPLKFYSAIEVLNFAADKKNGTNFYNTDFWGRLLIEEVQPFYSNPDHTKNNSFHILEIKAEVAPLKSPIFLKDKYRKSQGSWITLDSPLEQCEAPLELSPSIPSALRMRIFNLCNLEGDEAFYDIDHFVPKSIGGPGNIEENLRPIGASINRTKRDHIPSGLFFTAQKRGIHDLLGIRKRDTPIQFHDDQDSKQDAQKIVSYVNSLELSKVREFYREVRRIHNPNLDHISVNTEE